MLPQRIGSLPIPACRVWCSSGLPDILVCQGMFAPAATPKPVLEKLNAALRLALIDPKVIRNFEQTDFSVFPEQEQTIAAANSLVHQQIVRWGEVVRANHIEAVQ